MPAELLPFWLYLLRLIQDVKSISSAGWFVLQNSAGAADILQRIKPLNIPLVAEQASVWVGVLRRKLKPGLAVAIFAKLFCGFFPILFEYLLIFGVSGVHGHVWRGPFRGKQQKSYYGNTYGYSYDISFSHVLPFRKYWSVHVG